ncbi:MAG: VTT domain-containing protein, partial [Planctomycetota bacterium]
MTSNEPEETKASAPNSARSEATAEDGSAPAVSETSLGEVFQRLGPAGPLAVIALILPAIGGFALLGTLNIVGPWFKSHDELGVVVYAVGFAVFAGLAILPTYAQAALGGWAFGLWVGFPAALVGFFGGSIIGYAIARRASGDRVQELMREHEKWRLVRDALVGAGFWKTLGIVTLVRIPVNSPFAATNLVMAAVKTPVAPYLIGTLVGMAPRTLAYVYVASLIQGEFTSEDVTSKPVWYLPAALISAVVVIVIVGWVANRALKQATAT